MRIHTYRETHTHTQLHTTADALSPSTNVYIRTWTSNQSAYSAPSVGQPTLLDTTTMSALDLGKSVSAAMLTQYVRMALNEDVHIGMGNARKTTDPVLVERANISVPQLVEPI